VSLFTISYLNIVNLVGFGAQMCSIGNLCYH